MFAGGGHGGVHLLGERAQPVVVGEVDAHGIAPFGELVCGGEAAEQVDRQRNAGMRDRVERGDGFKRIAHEVVDRHRLVADPVDETGIGAVLQQPAHQIGQQVLVRAHRRIDAAGHVEAVGGDHLGVQVVAHAVEFLEFVGVLFPFSRKREKGPRRGG